MQYHKPSGVQTTDTSQKKATLYEESEIDACSFVLLSQGVSGRFSPTCRSRDVVGIWSAKTPRHAGQAGPVGGT
jgi:hypothetical protein